MSLINSLHSFFLKLSRPATIAAITVITLLFLWLINFQGVPGIPPIASLLRIGLPDMSSPTLRPPSMKSSSCSARMAAPPIASFWNASISFSPRSTDSSLLRSPPSASHLSSPTDQPSRNSACFPCSPLCSTTRKTSVSWPSSEAFRWSCQTWKSSPTYSPWPSGLSPQSVSYCCWWQLWVC